MSRFAQFCLCPATAAAIVFASVTASTAATLPIAEFRQACQHAIKRVEAASDVPENLLTAISFVESARWDSDRQAIIAWPWTVTSGGEGRFFRDKASAIAHVRALKRKGVRNIDVGCMQVNLHYHPKAFASLEEAFDPVANARYAAKFLGSLHRQQNSWSAAIQRYHSADPVRGGRYRQRVLKFWNNRQHDRQQTTAEAYRQSVIAAYKQRRAERLRAHRSDSAAAVR